MTIEKTTNDKLLKGLGHIYQRLNERFNRVEALIDEILRRQEAELGTFRCDLDDLSEEITSNTEITSANFSALFNRITRATPPKQNRRDRLQHSTRQARRSARLAGRDLKHFNLGS